MACWRCDRCGATNCDIDFCTTCGKDFAEEEEIGDDEEEN